MRIDTWTDRPSGWTDGWTMLTLALFFRLHFQTLQPSLLSIGQQGILLLQHLLFHAHSILPRGPSHPPALVPLLDSRPSLTVLFKTASHRICSPLRPWPLPYLPHAQHLLIPSNTIHSPRPAPTLSPTNPGIRHRGECSLRVTSSEPGSHSGQESSTRPAGTWHSWVLSISSALETVRAWHIAGSQ